MAKVTDTHLGDLRLLELENDELSISLLPEVGAKILAVYDKRIQRNLLWENPRIRPQRYPVDANFDNYWCGGWDDAFPTADPCEYNGEPYPNVGELRSLHWTVEEMAADDTCAVARLSAYGPITAIKATKTVVLTDRKIQMHFEIESLSPLPQAYLWGTHPAFAVTVGTKLMIPAGKGIVQQSTHNSLGVAGEEYDWPWLRGNDMSVVPDVTAGTACGHYATELTDGWYAVETDGNGVLFEFSKESCPCLWLWLVYGGWRGYHHAILEPWTGYPVNLAQAVQQGRHRTLAPGEKVNMTVQCTPYHAPEKASEALRRIRQE